MAGKPRVHELAKELGVDSKTVLAELQKMGEYVKSASSTVEMPVARRLRASMEAAGPVAAPGAPAAGPVNGAGATEVKPAPPRGKTGEGTRAPAKKAPVPAPPPNLRPTSAHDIEVAAAEQRATALKRVASPTQSVSSRKCEPIPDLAKLEMKEERCKPFPSP